MKKNPTPAALFRVLDQTCKWFEHYPTPASKKKAKTQLKLAFEEGCNATNAAVAIVWLDTECIYDVGDYTSVFQEIQTACYGLLGSATPQETWDSNTVTLTVTIKGKRYIYKDEYQSDYIPDSFFWFVNSIFFDLYGTLFLIDLVTGGQDVAFCLTSVDAFQRARENGFEFQSPLSYISPEWGEAENGRKRDMQVTKFLSSLEADGFFHKMNADVVNRIKDNIVRHSKDYDDPRMGLAVYVADIKLSDDAGSIDFTNLAGMWLQEIYSAVHPEISVEIEEESWSDRLYLRAKIGGQTFESSPITQRYFDLSSEWNPFWQCVSKLEDVITSATNEGIGNFYVNFITDGDQIGFMAYSKHSCLGANYALINSIRDVPPGDRLWKLILEEAYMYEEL